MTGEEVAAAAQLACLLEVSAPKPGNVSPGRDFHDTRYEDFLASAVAIGPALAAAGERPLGATIRAAVEATGRWTRSNTNLGIVLLLAPLARAARPARAGGGALRARLTRVLADSTVADAAEAYAAIRLARPGGLGQATAQDVTAAPTVTLRDAMALAAGRDGVAREYATDFALTFEVGAPALRAARHAGLSWADATVEGYLGLLSEHPDTHIARKLGREEAERVSARAAAVRGAGGVRTPAGREALAVLDRELRDPRNARNPGTTADLTCAALFVVILEYGWHS
ncbi:MAG TPA: triphosphoribosyl-dephospho-CoA synthase [Gemmatimonadales bacterium]|nr:triphosphoribosyl-dephospho-CoA synthase [Gemmatimonadales bacterium]